MNDDLGALDAEFDPILAEIGDAFDADLPPIPDRLTAAALDAFRWRLVDTELAELLFDSTRDELAGVRGGVAGARRSLRFGSGEHVVRVHLTEQTMVIMIEPPIVAGVRVTTAAGTVEFETDEFGEVATDAPDYPVRIEFDLPGGTVVTPWIGG